MKRQLEAGDRIQCDLSFNPIALTQEGLPDGYIAGVASTANVDLGGHKVLAGAFDESIRQKGFAGPAGIQLLIGHDWNKVGGKIMKMETVNDRLLMEAQLYMDVSYVKDVHTVLKQNGGLNFSVGFTLDEFELPDVKKETDPWLIVKKGNLAEVSIVTFPCQPDAQMTFIKELETMTDFEKALVADGICYNRSQSHKLLAWVKKNVHLLQPKPPLLGEEAPESAHPLLDVSLLKPMADLIAKARAHLP
jgi:HK97 family phage prohead protease